MEDLEVHVRYTCPRCGGSGAEYNHDWDAVQPSWSEERIREYFRDLGYDDPPPEERDCSYCGGTGKVEEWVPLSRLLLRPEAL